MTRSPALTPGLVVGSWVLVRREPGPKGVRWLARCACGAERFVWSQHLKAGTSRSCRECARQRCTKHGLSGSVEYAVWLAMRSRCNNPRNRRYHLYGGAGITVCERWDTSFEAFLADLGACRWDQTLQRIDKKGPYAPGNALWATKRALL